MGGDLSACCSVGLHYFWLKDTLMSIVLLLGLFAALGKYPTKIIHLSLERSMSGLSEHFSGAVTLH